MKKMKCLSVILVLILLIASLSGCAAKSEYSTGNGMAADMAAPEAGIYDSVAETVAASDGEEAPKTQSQKLIRKMHLDTETNDMDVLLGQLDSKIAALGGYVESKSVRNGGSSSTRSYRYADLVIRIPENRLDEFVDHVSDASNVVNYTESADDITLTYVATQSRITALETEQTRLLELLAQAENMTDLLQIEQRLTDVRTQLEQYNSQLRVYDNLVNYGTVNLSVTEVQEFTPVEEETVWQRIGSGLKTSWNGLVEFLTDLFVFLIVSLPILVPLVILPAIVIIFVVKRAKKKRAAKQDPPVI